MFSVEYELPEDVQVEVQEKRVIVRSGSNEVQREFKAKHVQIRVEGAKIIVETKSPKKSDRAIVRTIMAHIKNMVRGVKEGITYRLKAVYSHFPMSITVEGSKFSVTNFLGEKNPRTMIIPQGVTVEVKGQDIIVTGSDKEKAGLCASQIEQLCRVTDLDRRIFQDGIYIVEKDGKLIK